MDIYCIWSTLRRTEMHFFSVSIHILYHCSVVKYGSVWKTIIYSVCLALYITPPSLTGPDCYDGEAPQQTFCGVPAAAPTLARAGTPPAPHKILLMRVLEQEHVPASGLLVS